MNALWHEVWRGVQNDFADLPGVAEVTQIVLRLLLAALLGGLVGFQRERVAKRPVSGRTCSWLSGQPSSL